MGGYGSMHLALKYPEVFSVVAAQAGHYDRDTSGWKIRLEYVAPLNPKDFEEFSLLGFSERSGFALAAAISPNPAIKGSNLLLTHVKNIIEKKTWVNLQILSLYEFYFSISTVKN